jgi:hypothetical protein
VSDVFHFWRALIVWYGDASSFEAVVSWSQATELYITSKHNFIQVDQKSLYTWRLLYIHQVHRDFMVTLYNGLVIVMNF